MSGVATTRGILNAGKLKTEMPISLGDKPLEHLKLLWRKDLGNT